MKLSTSVAVAILVVSSMVAVGPVGSSMAVASGPDELSTCTTITEPGRYVLTENVSSDAFTESACLQIAASDVVLDGQGHTVSDILAFRTAIRAGSREQRVSNVTVRNVSIIGLRSDAIRYQSVAGGTIDDVTLDSNKGGVHLRNSSAIRVTNSSFEGQGAIGPTTSPSSYGVRVSNTSDAVFAANRLDKFIRGAAVSITADSTNTTVTANEIRGCVACDDDLVPGSLSSDAGYGVGVEIDGASGTAVVNNDIGYHDEGIRVEGPSGATTVERNTISHTVSGVLLATTGPSPTGNSLERDVVANNSLTANSVGLRVRTTSQPLLVQHNAIVGNDYGMYTPEAGVCPPDGEDSFDVEVTANDIANNSQYGLLNDRSETLNATDNYWGAASGPSSANDSDAPFEDPVTGTLADGEGSAVSEYPDEPGVANVHFDPWATQSVANATAAGDR